MEAVAYIVGELVAELPGKDVVEGGSVGVFEVEEVLEEAEEVFDHRCLVVIEESDVQAALDARFHFQRIAGIWDLLAR